MARSRLEGALPVEATPARRPWQCACPALAHESGREVYACDSPGSFRSRRAQEPLIETLRTPDERFASLPDFAYRPRYVEGLRGYEGLRAAVVDEGPRDARHTYLCLHGQPTWSYLYRRMIPVFLKAGGRVVAPDLPGFGRSDKPADDARYTFAFHRDFLLRLVERLELQSITLVCQDWGGLLGLTLPVDAGFAARLERLLVMNTTIAVGQPPSAGFLAWRDYCRANPDLAVGKLMKRAVPSLSDEEAAAYDAPFPDARYKAGVRRFPELVATDPSMPGVDEGRAALDFWTNRWSGPTFMAIGAADPVLGVAVMEALKKRIRGCPPPLVLAEAGHFVQEWGDRIAAAALASWRAAESVAGHVKTRSDP